MSESTSDPKSDPRSDPRSDAASTAVHVDLDRVRRYNQPGPRYTSYPTAPHFTESYDADAFTADDRLRRRVIMQLMCHFSVDKAAVERRFGIDFDTTFADALDALGPMEADGLVTLTPTAVHVADAGRLFIRNVAMAFDAYLAAPKRKATYSSTV